MTIFLLYCYLGNFETLANFGTVSHPKLHKLIGTIPQGCIPHLICDRIQSHHLTLNDAKQPIVVSIPEKNCTTIHTFGSMFPSIPRLVTHKLDRISTPYCRVQIVWMHLPATMDIAMSNSFGIFLEFYSRSYFNTNPGYIIAKPAGRVYVLVMLNTLHKSLQYSSLAPLYIPLNVVLPHFAVLFLPFSEDKESTLCTSNSENSVPFLRNMECFEFLLSDNLLSFYSMIRMPSDWAVVLLETYKKSPGYFTSTRHIADAILVQHLNFTWNWTYHWEREASESMRIDQKCLRVIIIPDLLNILNKLDSGTPVGYETIKYAFVTCHYKEDINFRFYINPFQPIVWISIAVSLATLIILGEAFFSVKYNQFRFYVTFYIWATIFEQSNTVTSTVMNTKFFRALIMVWLMSVTSLTSSYRSLVISSLNSPPVIIFPKTLQVSI